MSQTKHQLTFRVSAHLQKLIGEELITNEQVALLELVKNSYDSGAKRVIVSINPRERSIRIEDNGAGMTLDEFQKRFMFAAYSERPKEATTATRIPTGEKGIGRFAVDKLGSQLTVLTRTKAQQNVLKVEFDWTKFQAREKLFTDIPIDYEYTDEWDNPSKTGTVLIISRLRDEWDTRRTDNAKRALQGLMNPFSPPKDFVIELRAGDTTKVIEELWPQRPEAADYEIQFKVEPGGKLYRKFQGAKRSSGEWKQEPSPGSLEKLPGVKGRLLYYIKRPNRSQSKGISPGVELYRDGFVMQPFGAPLSDRLDLVEKRAKRAGHAPLVPTRLFGFVEISRRKHPGLRDTTGRQAMLETDEMYQLLQVLKHETNFLEENILEDVSKPSWQESSKSRATERLKSLGDLSVGIGHEIRQPLQQIIAHTDAIERRLMELQIEDNSLADSLSTINSAVDRIDETIEFVKKFAAGDLQDISEFDLADSIRKECKLYQADVVGVEISVEAAEHQVARTNEATVLQVLSNLLRNAIDAIGEATDNRAGIVKVKLKKIAKRHQLTVEDNGMGMAASTKKQLFTKFTTKKTGGYGFGLSYCREILALQNGGIMFDSTPSVGTTFTVTFPDLD